MRGPLEGCQVFVSDYHYRAVECLREVADWFEKFEPKKGQGMNKTFVSISVAMDDAGDFFATVVIE